MIHHVAPPHPNYVLASSLHDLPLVASPSAKPAPTKELEGIHHRYNPRSAARGPLPVCDSSIDREVLRPA
jgi:hypothetical protein